MKITTTQVLSLLLTLTATTAVGQRSADAQYYPHTHTHSGSYYNNDPHYGSYSNLTYGARSHLDQLAAELKYSANRVAWDMWANYQRNPGYAETYRETYQMLQDAKHIYTLVFEEQYHHQHHEKDHIAYDLAEIDRLFHHIEQDIAQWQPTIYNPYHDQGLLHAKMEKLEDILHHLMADYGVTSQIPAGGGGGFNEPPPPQASFAPQPYGAPQAGGRPYSAPQPVLSTNSYESAVESLDTDFPAPPAVNGGQNFAPAPAAGF